MDVWCFLGWQCLRLNATFSSPRKAECLATVFQLCYVGVTGNFCILKISWNSHSDIREYCRSWRGTSCTLLRRQTKQCVFNLISIVIGFQWRFEKYNLAWKIVAGHYSVLWDPSWCNRVIHVGNSLRRCLVQSAAQSGISIMFRAGLRSLRS